jgi:hypothetical protein
MKRKLGFTSENLTHDCFLTLTLKLTNLGAEDELEDKPHCCRPQFAKMQAKLKLTSVQTQKMPMLKQNNEISLGTRKSKSK